MLCSADDDAAGLGQRAVHQVLGFDSTVMGRATSGVGRMRFNIDDRLRNR